MDARTTVYYNIITVRSTEYLNGVINMSFGNIIKKLRLDKNITQEQLAEVLSISAQAISRWETNAALPDISLLPVLANFFDVTTDSLLEVDISKREKEIEMLLECAREYTSAGQWNKGIDILRKSIKKYPSVLKLYNELAHALFSSPQELRTIPDENHTELLQEVVSLEEYVLENSKDTELRFSAIQLLCYVYPKLKMSDKAETLAKTMPYAHQCKEELLVSVSDKTNRYRYQQDAILTHLQLMLSGIAYNCAPLDDNRKPYTAEEMILLNKKVIDILNIIFEDKNYGFFSQTIAWTYLNIAWFYAKINDRCKAIEYLKLAKEQAIENDATPYNPKSNYTCIIARSKEYGEKWNNIKETDSQHQINEMNDKIYDFIRDDIEFKSIIEELEQYT